MTRGPEGEPLSETLSETQWTTRREAARLANVHYNTIKLWESSGRLHPRRVVVENVEEVRIDLAELQRIIAERQHREAAEAVDRPSIPEGQLWEAYEGLQARLIELERDRAALAARNELLEEEKNRAQGEWERLMAALIRGYQAPDPEAAGGSSPPGNAGL